MAKQERGARYVPLTAKQLEQIEERRDESGRIVGWSIGNVGRAGGRDNYER